MAKTSSKRKSIGKRETRLVRNLKYAATLPIQPLGIGPLAMYAYRNRGTVRGRQLRKDYYYKKPKHKQ